MGWLCEVWRQGRVHVACGSALRTERCSSASWGRGRGVDVSGEIAQPETSRACDKR